MTVTFEGAEFQCNTTHPLIPYTLYVGDSYLLLVPRVVAKVHRNFPTTQGPPQQFKLQLSDHWKNEYKKKVNQEPKFHYKHVDFGLDDDEVVVAALLPGSNSIPHWEFRTLLNGEDPGNKHLTEISSDAEASFGMMKWDLAQASGPPLSRSHFLLE